MNNNTSTSKGKNTYTKPQIKSEKLVTFGAVCNGTTGGQRKASTGAPHFCRSNKLLS